MKNKIERICNWKVKVYNENDCVIDTWIIQDRTEQQAVKEAEAEIDRIPDVNDWTMVIV